MTEPQKQVILQTAEHVKSVMQGEATGHDWWHVNRVWQLSQTICQDERSANAYVVELTALLHDVADWKFADGDMEAGPRAAHAWLASLQVDEAVILHVEDIIRNMSYRGSGVQLKLNSLEAQIVSDADKLDAMGAIGIARAFAYGGNQGRPIYEPDLKPVLHDTFEAYKNGKSHTVNHFYEKLLLLKDRMQTKTGRHIAEQRHEFMKQYLDQFYAEWGKS
jgi:uncharacterized protein